MSLITPQNVGEMREVIEGKITRYRGWYIVQALIFIMAGILAIVLPAATAVGFEFLIGALFLISGTVQIFASFRSKVHWWSLLSGLLSVVAGGIMLANPAMGTLALATVLAVFLTVEGVFELLLAFQFRPARNWIWLLTSGLVSLVLALLLFAGWPETTIVYLGIIIGVNFLLYGVSLLAMTIWVKRAPSDQ